MLGNGGNGRDVVRMSERDKNRKLAPLRNIEAYWHGLCSENDVPLRSQIDPRGMENALEYAFLMERIAPSMAKIRVAGSHLSDLMGMQIAGMPLSSLIAPSDRDRFGQAVTKLFGDPAVVRIDLKAEGGFGKPDLEGHMLLLPLKSDFGDMSRGLGVFVSNGKIGRTPRRFAITNIDVKQAVSSKIESGITDRRPVKVSEPEPAPMRSFQEPAKPFKGKLSAASPAKTAKPAAGKSIRGTSDSPQNKRGHLRLIVSND
ncbi:PAS domain-containing protein [Pelagimonas varians]|uniref:PAS domain protein n=1 Tax=Pelagimonas varians TaxID=696760 RepID=A0A238JPF0_9RHOB|nr:PAS domain-containing protein [Pelagimonas varians]PYG34755.1 PAS domain-containing protein [Pelagimonas varians]SMX32549.1 PAS domain protein [Pelagimonas varians]